MSVLTQANAAHREAVAKTIAARTPGRRNKPPLIRNPSFCKAEFLTGGPYIKAAQSLLAAGTSENIIYVCAHSFDCPVCVEGIKTSLAKGAGVRVIADAFQCQRIKLQWQVLKCLSAAGRSPDCLRNFGPQRLRSGWARSWIRNPPFKGLVPTAVRWRCCWLAVPISPQAARPILRLASGLRLQRHIPPRFPSLRNFSVLQLGLWTSTRRPPGAHCLSAIWIGVNTTARVAVFLRRVLPLESLLAPPTILEPSAAATQALLQVCCISSNTEKALPAPIAETPKTVDEFEA